MKDIYVKPELDVVECDFDVYMLSLSTEGDVDIEYGGDSEGGKEADGNRYRGEWGNLWAED